MNVKGTIAGAALAVLAALACSACGATRVVTVTNVVKVKHPAPEMNRLPIRRTGVGSASFGTFAMHGWLYVKAACVGTGTFGLYFNNDGSSMHCRGSRLKPTVMKTSSNFAVNRHRARIHVQAPAGMKWSVIIFEGPADVGPHALNVW